MYSRVSRKVRSSPLAISMSVRIAVEGCCHGALNQIYRSVPKDVDLLLICGDFQAFRNSADLKSFSAPEKYRLMMDFHEYYSGKKKAPVLTIFIGGNHEASLYLRELQFGGWVAPSIYYLGEYGTVWYKGLRISGTSGIFNYDSFIGKEKYSLPYNHSAIRSVYHVKPKNFVKQLLTGHADIVLSHDWPQWIWKRGDSQSLLRRKKHFKSDMKSGRLGSPLAMEVLKYLRPRYWFSLHLHTKFTAQYKHTNKRKLLDSEESLEDSIAGSKKANDSNEIPLDMGQSVADNKDLNEIPLDMDKSVADNKDLNEFSLGMDKSVEDNKDSNQISLDMDEPAPDHEKKQASFDLDSESSVAQDASRPLIEAVADKLVKGATQKTTSFLALDKCLPKRKFLEILTIKTDTPSSDKELYYDPRAIAIHKVVEKAIKTMQWDKLDPRSMLKVSSIQPLLNELEEKVKVELQTVTGDLRIPRNFKRIAPPSTAPAPEVKYWENSQTNEFCKKFGIPKPDLE